MTFFPTSLFIVVSLNCQEQLPEIQVTRTSQPKLESTLSSLDLLKGLSLTEFPETRYPWNSDGDELFQRADAATRKLFKVDTLELVRKVGLKKGASEVGWAKTSDVLYATWNIRAYGTQGTLLLEDNMLYSSYVLRLANIPVSELAPLLTSVLADKRPLGLKRQISLQVSQQDERQAQFANPVMYGSHESNEAFAGGVHTKDGDWIFTFRWGKGLLRSDYGNTEWIPERIPSLEVRARTWSDRVLFDEIGRPGNAKSRTMLLLRSYLERNPSMTQLREQLLSIIQTNPRAIGELEDRISQLSILLAARDEARSVEFREMSLNLLSNLSAQTVNKAASIAFGSKCVPALEQAAARFIADGLLLASSLEYVSYCSSSDEMIAVIERAKAPAEMDATKVGAIHSIRRRKAELHRQ